MSSAPGKRSWCEASDTAARRVVLSSNHIARCCAEADLQRKKQSAIVIGAGRQKCSARLQHGDLRERGGACASSAPLSTSSIRSSKRIGTPGRVSRGGGHGCDSRGGCRQTNEHEAPSVAFDAGNNAAQRAGSRDVLH